MGPVSSRAWRRLPISVREGWEDANVVDMGGGVGGEGRESPSIIKGRRMVRANGKKKVT